jgi:hypothetical protein
MFYLSVVLSVAKNLNVIPTIPDTLSRLTGPLLGLSGDRRCLNCFLGVRLPENVQGASRSRSNRARYTTGSIILDRPFSTVPAQTIALAPFDFSKRIYVWAKRNIGRFVLDIFFKFTLETKTNAPETSPARLREPNRVPPRIVSAGCGPETGKLNVKSELFPLICFKNEKSKNNPATMSPMPVAAIWYNETLCF